MCDCVRLNNEIMKPSYFNYLDRSRDVSQKKKKKKIRPSDKDAAVESIMIS